MVFVYGKDVNLNSYLSLKLIFKGLLQFYGVKCNSNNKLCDFNASLNNPLINN